MSRSLLRPTGLTGLHSVQWLIFLMIGIIIPWMVTCYVEEEKVLSGLHVFTMEWEDGQNTVGVCNKEDLELLAGDCRMEEESRSWVDGT